ncbi:MAG: SRPBCC domain-containing protein [Flavipsychrobacter sp.]|nr:SRPBCC domain-containing protein [Flavipsychrobacter sp.]
MERHEFKTTINASRERVWQVLWGDDTYPQWTAPFAEGSRAESDWQVGSKVLFLDGKGRGMVSSVHERRDNEYMGFRHLGEVADGEEKINESAPWYNAEENYTLSEANGTTELKVEIDLTPADLEYMGERWPEAMKKLKEIAENA